LHFFHAGSKESFFQTGWFVESLLSQTLIVHVIRTGKIPFLQSQASAALTGTTVAICLLGLWLPVSHFAPALSLAPLPHQYLLALIGILAGYLTLTQLVKTWIIKRFGLN
jgi:Mg2+-importing ATPase